MMIYMTIDKKLVLFIVLIEHFMQICQQQDKGMAKKMKS